MGQEKMVGKSVGTAILLLLILLILPAYTVEPFVLPEVEKTGAAKVEYPQNSPDYGKQDSHVRLRVLQGDRVEEMDLGTYLTGVVRAEMPASFPEEALKAQAVAARTYTVRALTAGSKHGEADICTDPGCCQAWIGQEEAAKNWGDSAQKYERAVENAVAETDGQVLLFGGEPILAVFHASSAGATRAAGAVWQRDVPYLQQVASPEQGNRVPNYYSRVAFTEAEFRERMAEVAPKLEGRMDTWLRNPVRDSTGNVETVEIGGVTVRGTRLRELLGLRSACFTWETQGEELVFFVTGHGHGVGMSQYGAGQMALDGSSYEEILTHYYQGTELGELSGLGQQFSATP